MKKKYKVRFWADGDYAVFEVDVNGYGEICGELGSPLLVGSLADCEAYIRLNEQGYMD